MTCSGGSNTGSLRVVKHGAYYVEKARITNVPNVQKMWPLKNVYSERYSSRDCLMTIYSASCRHQSLLLVSTPVSSRILQVPFRSFSSGKATLSAIDVEGFAYNSTTIAAGNLVQRTTSPTNKSMYDEASSIMAQVTPSAVYLLDLNLRIVQDTWRPGTTGIAIVAADISPSQICVALSGGKIVLLNVLNGKLNQQMCVWTYP